MWRHCSLLSSFHQRHFKSSQIYKSRTLYTMRQKVNLRGSLDLKAFSHYVKAHTRKISSSTFIYEMEFSALQLEFKRERERERERSHENV